MGASAPTAPSGFSGGAVSPCAQRPLRCKYWKLGWFACTLGVPTRKRTMDLYTMLTCEGGEYCPSTDLYHDNLTGLSVCEDHIASVPDNATTVRELIKFLADFDPDMPVVAIEDYRVRNVYADISEDAETIVVYPIPVENPSGD